MCPCTQKATSPPSQKLCHKTAKEATKEEDPIDMAELVESLFGPKTLEYPELGLTLAVAEADESCAAGSDSSDETPLPLSEAEVDEMFADEMFDEVLQDLGSRAGSSAFHATLGA